MPDWAEYTKFFLALLVIVNPLGAVPLFASMTAGNSAREKQQIARIASVAVATVLVLAAIAGQPLLAFFGITIASFKVGGAILILLLAISQLPAAALSVLIARHADRKKYHAVLPLRGHTK
jgi:multiple antibiotic resistance protein